MYTCPVCHMIQIPAKEIEGRLQANRQLIEFTKSLFGGNKKIDVYQFVAPAPVGWDCITVINSGDAITSIPKIIGS
jgi:hypothetical protein